MWKKGFLLISFSLTNSSGGQKEICLHYKQKIAGGGLKNDFKMSGMWKGNF